MVYNRGQVEVFGRVAEDGVVPEFEVRVGLDELRQRRPFVRRGDEAGAIRARGSRLWTRWLEGILGPRQSSVARGVERGGSERGGVSLSGEANEIRDKVPR